LRFALPGFAGCELCEDHISISAAELGCSRKASKARTTTYAKEKSGGECAGRKQEEKLRLAVVTVKVLDFDAQKA
jgi:hypothetical protein